MLASGTGTNLQALIETSDPHSEICVVITDRDGTGAADKAAKAGLPARVVRYGDFADRDSFCSELVRVAESYDAEALVLAGFMRILSPLVVERYRDRILNVHPSLLPAFPGANAVAQAIRHGVKVTGVTVHFVDEEVDHGPIIAQRPVEVLPGDSEETLHERIQIEEHKLYPEVVAGFARGLVSVVDGVVVWR